MYLINHLISSKLIDYKDKKYMSIELNKIYNRDKTVSKYIKLDTPINGLNIAKVQVYYHKRDFQRNSCYMLSITPVEIIDNNGYSMERWSVRDGGILVIEYVNRYNAKKFEIIAGQAMDSNSENFKMLLEHIYSRQA